MYTLTHSPLALLNSLRRRWREIQSHTYTHTHAYNMYIYIYVHHIVQSLAAKDLLVLVSQLAPVGLVLLPLSSATLRRQCSEVMVILGWNEDFPHCLPFMMTPQWPPNVFKCNCDYVDIFMASKFMIQFFHIDTCISYVHYYACSYKVRHSWNATFGLHGKGRFSSTPHCTMFSHRCQVPQGGKPGGAWLFWLLEILQWAWSHTWHRGGPSQQPSEPSGRKWRGSAALRSSSQPEGSHGRGGWSPALPPLGILRNFDGL